MDLNQKLEEYVERIRAQFKPGSGRSGPPSGHCLILCTERPQLSAVLVSFDHTHVRILKSLQRAWPEHATPTEAPAEAGRWLKEQLAEAGMNSSQAFVVLPREDVVVRRVELPAAPDHEIPDLLQMQAATRFTIPLDRLALDYVPLPPREDFSGREVTAMAVPSSVLTSVKLMVEAAGLHLLGATVSSFALLAIDWSGTPPEESEVGAGLIVAMTGDLLELAIVSRSVLLFSHSSRLPNDDPEARTRAIAAEIARARVAVQAIQPGLTWNRIELLCDPELRPTLEPKLEQRLGAAIGTLPVFNAQGVETSREVAELSESLWAKAVGGSILLANPDLEAVDFLSPRKPAAPLDRRVLAKRGGIAAAILILLVWYWGLQSYAGRLEDEIARMQGRGAELDQILESGEPDLARHDAIALWVDQGPDWLDEFDQLRQLMPPAEEMYLTQITARSGSTGRAGTMIAQTRAKDRVAVQEIARVLAEQPRYRVQPYQVITANRDPEYPIESELRVDLVNVNEGDEAEEDPAAAGEPTAPAAASAPAAAPIPE